MKKSISDLESVANEAIKEHHWFKIQTLLCIDKKHSQITIEEYLQTQYKKYTKEI